MPQIRRRIGRKVSPEATGVGPAPAAGPAATGSLKLKLKLGSKNQPPSGERDPSPPRAQKRKAREVEAVAEAAEEPDMVQLAAEFNVLTSSPMAAAYIDAVLDAVDPIEEIDICSSLPPPPSGQRLSVPPTLPRSPSIASSPPRLSQETTASEGEEDKFADYWVDCTLRALGQTQKPFYEDTIRWQHRQFQWIIITTFRLKAEALDTVLTKKLKLETVTIKIDKIPHVIGALDFRRVDNLIEQALRKKGKRKDILVQVDLKFIVDRLAEAAATQAAAALATQPVSSVSKSKKKKPMQMANITTQSMLEDVSEESYAHFVEDLQSRWICRLPQCRGQSTPLKLCFREVEKRDEPRNHYPLAAEDLKFWAQECQMKKTTTSLPTAGHRIKMRSHGSGLPKVNKRVKHAPDLSYQQPQFQYQSPQIQAPASSPWQPFIMVPNPMFQMQPQLQMPVPGPVPTPSSPVERSESPPSQIRNFMDWIRKRYPAERLADVEHALIDQAWDLEGIRKDLSPTDWANMELRAGEYSRIKRYLREYKDAKFGLEGEVESSSEGSLAS